VDRLDIGRGAKVELELDSGHVGEKKLAINGVKYYCNRVDNKCRDGR
jgi:hypothetical protein